ncbi:MAG: hypothetical protein EZS28_001362 [Streblomastix strix]|uniref:Cyclin N-terminal domain-containing protein n=1 Tax=Streblomastix strix TaxID=222440 RepID=A0A5J4X956_9EUKA|nr:MAG: hypothetical protein EZS28_001362 [Streblomastix strix]
MGAQCAIIALIYIERLITDIKVTLHPINWRRIIIISLLTSAKMWEDRVIFDSHIIKRAFLFIKVVNSNKIGEEFQITWRWWCIVYRIIEERRIAKVGKSSLKHGQNTKKACQSLVVGKETHSWKVE